MEIERKYLIRHLPDHLGEYPCRQIEQAYLSINPVVRIRRESERKLSLWKLNANI